MQVPQRVEEILDHLRDPSFEIRQDAARKLKGTYEDEALPLLLHAATDEDMDVRLAVVDSLNNFKSQEAEDALLQALFDEEWEVKWAALRGLGSLWGEAHIRKMGDKLLEKRVSGIEALEKKPTPKYLKPLLAMLDDEEEVQVAAARTLTRLRDPDAIPHLKDIQNEGSKELRAIVEETLINLGDIDTIRAQSNGSGAQIACDVCQQMLPLSFLKKVGSWREDDILYLCQFHYEEHVEKIQPFEGKLKTCKVCKTNWPKADVNEGMCPNCREKRYYSMDPAPEGQFRCFLSHKVRYERDKSPIDFKGFPVSHRSIYQLIQQSAKAPFLTSQAIKIMQGAFDKGYLMCEQCRTFQPLKKIVKGEDFREECVCDNCDQRGAS